MDESIFRVDGHRQWIWVFVTEEDLLPVIRPLRSRDVVEEVLGKDYPGKIVCDGWRAYLGWVLLRCWAHLLRYGKEGAEKSAEGKRICSQLCQLHEKLTRGLETASLRARARRRRRGTRALERMLRRHGGERGPGGPEGADVPQERDAVVADVPGTVVMEEKNNRGERGLREAIVIRKIIGALRIERGATAFTRLLSVLGTWGLRGEDLVAKLYGVLSRPS